MEKFVLIVRDFTILILSSVIIMIGFSPAFGHTTSNIGPYEIEIGWDTEPSIVGFRNAIVFKINEVESENVKAGVTNAFNNLQAIAKFGGITKTLDINSDPRPGHYFSKIIPTRTGTIEIDLKGEINGVAVDVSVPVEEVENTAVLDFPPRPVSGSSEEYVPLKNAVSSIQQDLIEIKSTVEGIDTNIASQDVERAYNFGIFGLSLGSAGVILAIISLVRRK